MRVEPFQSRFICMLNQCHLHAHLLICGNIWLSLVVLLNSSNGCYKKKIAVMEFVSGVDSSKQGLLIVLT